MKISSVRPSRLSIISLVVAFIVMLPMIFGIGLRISYFIEAGRSAGDGITMVLNDPGKIFFHIVLLPIIAFCLVRFAPYGSFRDFINRKNIFYPTLFFTVLLLYLSAIVVLNDMHSGFCDRGPTPDNFINPQKHSDIYNSWVNNHENLRNMLINSEAMRKPDFRDKYYKKLDSSYKESYRAYIPGPCKYLEHKSAFGLGLGQCNYYKFNLGSLSAKNDGLLTFIAIWCGLFLLLSLIVHIFYWRPPSIEQITSLRIILFLALLWFPLRWYSEWYIHFGNTDENSRHFDKTYPQIIIAAAFLALLVFFSVFAKKKQNVVTRSDTIMYTISFGQFGFIAIMNIAYSLLERMAIFVDKATEDIKYILYVFALIAIAGIVGIVAKDVINTLKTLSKKVLLFITSSPKGLNIIGFDREFNTIGKAINEKREHTFIVPKILVGITRSEFIQQLIQNQPSILHIAMHGSEKESENTVENAIYFQDEECNRDPVSPQEFVEMVRASGIKKLDLIVFSACCSHAHAKLSKEVCYHAIGTDLPIPDNASIVYAGLFYRNIFNDVSDDISRCHSAGVLALRLKDKPPFKLVKGIAVHNIFKLY